VPTCPAQWDRAGQGGGLLGLVCQQDEAGSVCHRGIDDIQLAVIVKVRVNEKDFFVADALTKVGLRRLTSID
jgi:hypothetical protein